MLDLSFNHIARNNSEFLECLLKFFSRHKDLLHLDLSHNGFSSSEMEQIARSVGENKNIFGIHMEGLSHNYIVDGKQNLHEAEKLH